MVFFFLFQREEMSFTSITPVNKEIEVVSKGHKLIQRLSVFHSRYPIFNISKVTAVSRATTFENVARCNIRTSIHELVQAGFFYCNVSNSIKCYLCGLQIRNFEKITNPFAVHFHNNPSCTHITLIKGTRYVEILKRDGFAENNTVIVIEKSHDLICVVCKINSVNILLLPCKHVITCAACTSNLCCCPMCRVIMKSFAFIHT
jgi:Inhibitor of Apoptosis domain/Zinc finger, C3HC4 type (RING finger)